MSRLRRMIQHAKLTFLLNAKFSDSCELQPRQAQREHTRLRMVLIAGRERSRPIDGALADPESKADVTFNACCGDSSAFETRACLSCCHSPPTGHKTRGNPRHLHYLLLHLLSNNLFCWRRQWHSQRNLHLRRHPVGACVRSKQHQATRRPC